MGFFIQTRRLLSTLKPRKYIFTDRKAEKLLAKKVLFDIEHRS